MQNFKTWLEEIEDEVGEPKGPKPTTTHAITNKLVNKAFSKIHHFLMI